MADGSGGLTRATCAHGLHIKAIREKTREADFVASTDAMDSYGEIVEQVWKLDRYLANPIVLFAHDSDELPIGVCTSVGVRAGQLQCTIQFSTEDLNPLAERVWRNVQAKVLRAVSVGFWPNTIRYELHDGQEVCVLSDCELFEISVVPIGANPEALAKAKAKAIEAYRATKTTDMSTINAPHGVARIGSDGSIEVRTSDTTVRLTESGVETKTMTEQEMKDAIAKSEKAVIDAKAETKAGADKLVERDAAHATAVAALEAKVKTLETEKPAFESQTKKLAEERDAAVKRAEDAEAKVIDAEVEALVGKKIKPTEKAMFIELRKTNEPLFKSMVEQRSDLKLTEQVIPPDTKAAVDGTPLGAPDTDAAMKRIEELGEDD